MATSTGISFSNFTGIDFSAILNAATAAAQVPIAAKQDVLVGVNTAISVLGSISGDFTSVQSALATLNSSLTAPPVGATVSAGSPFTASVTGTPINGTYSVAVSKLAQAQSVASQGYTSNTSKVGDGTISISIAGAAAKTITIDPTNDTLDGLANAINTTPNIGVTAQVVNTGAPGAPYRLELTSNSTGSAAAFSVSSSLAGGASPDFVNPQIGPTSFSAVTGTSTPTVGGVYTGSLSQGYQFSVVSGGTVGTDPITLKWTSDSGQSGSLSIPASASGPTAVVDGLTVSLGSGTLNVGDKFSAAAFVPKVSDAQNATVQVGNQIIVSQTNTVSNAIPGLTLQLSNTGTASSITVAPDLAAQGKNISAFVDAYNKAIGDVVYNTQALPKQATPALAGDGSLRSTLFTLQSEIGSLNLANLGITVDKQSGNLVFSQAGFVQAENTSPTAVNQSISDLYAALNPTVSQIIAPITGLIDTETTSYNSQKTSLVAQLTQMNNDLATYSDQLQHEYASIQATVAGYQSIANLFTAISSNSSSSGSTGSNLSVTG